MKTLRTALEVREAYNFKKFAPLNNRIAVISTIPISKRKQDLGVQFWTNEDIQKGFVTNSDNTISNLIELY